MIKYQKHVDIKLKGSDKNISTAIGSKVFVFANGGIRSYEKNPVQVFFQAKKRTYILG